MKVCSDPLIRLLGRVERRFGVEWTEHLPAFPHCNGQAGCWMHLANVSRPWCRCRCRWCALARRLGRGGGEPGTCRLCRGATVFGRDPATRLCTTCVARGEDMP